jgi:hypothetical protein
MPARARCRRSPIGPIAVALMAVFGTGCRGADSRTSDTLALPASATRAPADSAPTKDSAASIAAVAESAALAKPTCVSEGAWQTCSIEKRLTEAGFVLQKQTTPAANLFPLQGAEYALGPARLHVYLFPSAKERAAAVAAIDTVAITRPGTPPGWAGPAWLITSNNLVAVLVSDNGRLVERVQLALTAGLPSAAR